MGVSDSWVEIGDRVFVRRYAFYDQNIGLIRASRGAGDRYPLDLRPWRARSRSTFAS